ncbi:MAG: DUF2752 domain-containing protein [Planctomycetes bacterium]|nr:DUF2752 domain-containing protein [Planctomycetota bacterium]
MSTKDEIVELETDETEEDSVDEADATPIRRWARIFLLVLTVPWVMVFIVAVFFIDPYKDPGDVPRFGTHRQLGLPECNFKSMFELPCPSCGMTTSFTLLVRADVWNSMQANFAGTLLATFGMLFIPWALASAFFGRFVLIRRLEIVVFRLAIVFLLILFGRWGLVLLWNLVIDP